jgi:hypothetical protein
MAHPLEIAYGLSSTEILDAVAKRFRLRAALEGAIAEVQMERHMQALLGSVIERYKSHDLDGQPDFSIWLAGRESPLRPSARTYAKAARVAGKRTAAAARLSLTK